MQCATSCGVILPGVHPTAKTHSGESNSAMWWTLRCLSQVIKSSQKTIRCASNQGVKFRGVHLNTDSNSVVCIFLQSQANQCASLRPVKLHSVHPSAESSSAVCIPLQSQRPRCAFYCRVYLHGVMHTVDSITYQVFVYGSEVLQMLFHCDVWRY